MTWHLSNMKPDGCHTWLECNQTFKTLKGHCDVRDKRRLRAIIVHKIHSNENHAVGSEHRAETGCWVCWAWHGEVMS